MKLMSLIKNWLRFQQRKRQKNYKSRNKKRDTLIAPQKKEELTHTKRAEETFLEKKILLDQKIKRKFTKIMRKLVNAQLKRFSKRRMKNLPKLLKRKKLSQLSKRKKLHFQK